MAVHPLGEMRLLLVEWTLVRTRRGLIRMRLRRRRLMRCLRLARWCCVGSVRLHPNLTKEHSSRRLGETQRRRGDGEEKRRERRENDAPEWSGWLHGIENLCR